MAKKQFAVIGGGWSGLYALKYLLAENLDARLYEREASLGGVWLYKETEGGVYRSTHVTSSKGYLHASDFPLPEQLPHFPKHDQILAYLHAYADQFKLWPHMTFQCQIARIERAANDRWQVTIRRNGLESRETFDGLIIATGQHQTANNPLPLEPFNRFRGTSSHSISYKKPDEKLHHDKTILLVGGGETASDLAVELSAVARQIYMSIREGQWFQERLFGDQPADLLYNKAFALFGYHGNPLVRVGWGSFIRPFWGEGGTGIAAWKPRSRLFHGFLNKNRDVLDKVVTGQVVPKRGIREINEQLVTFDDGETPVHVDHILFCTGYRWSHPFLDETLQKETDVQSLYQMIFPVHLPNLAFVGSARPVFGSIPSMAELQARRVAQIFSGKASLPPVAQMSLCLAKYWKHHAEIFPTEKRLRQLVSQFEYSDYLAGELQAQPRLWKLFFTQPKKWYTIYFDSPWSPFLYRLNAIETDEEKLAYARHVKCIPRADQVFSQFTHQVRVVYGLVFLLFPLLLIALFVLLFFYFTN